MTSREWANFMLDLPPQSNDQSGLWGTAKKEGWIMETRVIEGGKTREAIKALYEQGSFNNKNIHQLTGFLDKGELNCLLLVASEEDLRRWIMQLVN